MPVRNRCFVYRLQKLMGTADLVLCPYNYIIDPGIRDAMDIKLTNSIIIFDEAHNIEDVCRESGMYALRVSMVSVWPCNPDAYACRQKHRD